jgi:hypothetical protein
VPLPYPLAGIRGKRGNVPVLPRLARAQLIHGQSKEARQDPLTSHPYVVHAARTVGNGWATGQLLGVPRVRVLYGWVWGEGHEARANSKAPAIPSARLESEPR